jgi:rod shape-determining protein MreC
LQRFLDFFIAFKEYVALTFFIAASLTLIAISRNADVGPVRAFATALVGAVQSTYAWIPNPVSLNRENKQLEENAIELAAEVGKLRRAEAENIELRRMLGIAPRKEWKLLPSEVVGKTTNFQRNNLTLNVGAADGVREGMAVVTDAGLVGRVLSVSQHFALVQMLLNTDVRVASKVARSRIEGIVTWDVDGGPTLQMEVPKALDVLTGDLVVTSEYSSYFPAEVPIGLVTNMRNKANSLMRVLVITPSVNFFRVEHCYVILKDDALERERLQLEEKAKQDVQKQRLKR